MRNVIYRRLRSSNRFFLFLAVLCFFWILYVIKVQLDLQRRQTNKDYLRGRIIELSKEYIRLVAKDWKEGALNIDGQTNAELKDLRQTTAILLQNMLDRLQVLERQVENVVAQSAMDISLISQQLKSLNNSIRKFNSSCDSPEDHCDIPDDPLYPECAAKVEWMKEHWKSDEKFSKNGVNGSLCSFLRYLSEVENVCPKRKTRNDCEIPNQNEFPDCHNKVQWMLKFWRSDQKFSANGVNGSMCSILLYLSEVETWCPLLPSRQKIHENDCRIPQHKAFPHCRDKVAWMKSSWKTDTCYARDYGVNGTICSFLYYLSEVENWCPKFPGRSPAALRQDAEGQEKVDIRSISVGKLLDRLTHVVAESRLAWIRSRVSRMWDYWVDGLKELQTRVNITEKAKKKILVHIGVLAEEKSLHFAETAGKGGPLGELVQWCDLITSLYILGHNVRVTVDHRESVSALTLTETRACPPKGSGKFDLIFTDYYGLQFLKKKAVLGYYGCRLRILDSFGTEAQFNFNGPLPRYSGILTGRNAKGSVFRKNNFYLKQYMTMFPHSPDNTFLGFVVDSKKNVPTSINKKPQALAYGKHYYMWKDLKSRAFLDVIREHFEIHATTGGLPLNEVKKFLPDYVINHGVVQAGQLQQLLRDSKLFIGLGFPYEGPAPLEALAQGCFYLNPKFNPPKNRQNTKFFNGKPTFRSLSSQHPYAEEFIGEPQVLTVNIEDINAVKDAMKKIINKESSPYLPFEYTHEGMLERVNALLHNQDFCNPVDNWPPLTSREVFMGTEGKSCKDICLKQGLVCEPAFFESINSVEFLKAAAFPCNTGNPITRPSLVAPAYIKEDNACVLQKQPFLYSCTASHSSVRRICPCRGYRKGQVALCKTCY